ncbi:hypothetical protein C8F01DRAFT_1149310, partial [Mycena amicta]
MTQSSGALSYFCFLLKVLNLAQVFCFARMCHIARTRWITMLVPSRVRSRFDNNLFNVVLTGAVQRLDKLWTYLEAAAVGLFV